MKLEGNVTQGALLDDKQTFGPTGVYRAWIERPHGLNAVGHREVVVTLRRLARQQILSGPQAEDAELSAFYAGLFESEARHHTTYTRLAKHFAPEEVVMKRLDELAALEAEIINRGEEIPRMHS